MLQLAIKVKMKYWIRRSSIILACTESCFSGMVYISDSGLWFSEFGFWALPCEWEMELQIAVPSLGESQLGGRQLRRKGIHELM